MDISEQLRTVLKYEEKRMGAVSSGMMRQSISEVEKMQNALENIEVQAVRGMINGWVCIPEVEWDAVMPNVI